VEGRNPTTTTVREAMTPDLIFGFEDPDVQNAAYLMEEHQIRHLSGLTRYKPLVGIVSLGDLAVSAGDQTLAGEVLEHVSEPAEPR